MGVGLVKLVSARHGSLRGAPFKVLVRMAVMALDVPNAAGQPACIYFGGWEPLAMALGYDVPVAGTDAGTRSRRVDLYELTRRAIRELETKGLVRRTEDHPRHGRRQVYQLCLSGAVPEQSPASSAGLADLESPASSAGQDPANSAGLKPRQFSGLSPASSAGPRKTEEEHEDLPQDSTHSGPDVSHDRAPEAHEPNPDVGQLVKGASAELALLPDSGMSLIEQMQAEMPDASTSEHVIAAARLAASRREAS